MTRMSVTVYLIVYGICQPIAGTLTDSFGRRTLVIISLVGYVICSLMIPQTTVISMLLIFRALQGVFAANIGVIARSMISDTYHGTEFKKYASYVTIAWAAGPILSPYLGAYLQFLFNWKAPFYFLATYSFISLILIVLALPETSQHRHEFNYKTFRTNYLSILNSRQFMMSAIICGIFYGVITLFNVVGPFLIETVLKYNEVVYGRIALALGVAWIGGNITARSLINNMPLSNISYRFMGIYSVAALLMMLFAMLPFFNLWTTFLPPIVFFYCGGVLFTYYFGHSLSLFKHMSGYASAALGSVFSILAGIMSGIGSFLEADTLFPLAITYLGLIFAAFISFRLLVSKKDSA